MNGPVEERKGVWQHKNSARLIKAEIPHERMKFRIVSSLVIFTLGCSK